MKTRLSKRIQSVMTPPLPALSAKLQQFQDGISFGQGVPFFIPPKEALDKFQKKIQDDKALHRYSLDEGLPEVRKLVSSLLVGKGIEATWHEVLMTSGANEACYISVLACCDAGDEAILATPFYFNHYMDLQLAEVKPILVDLMKDWQLDVEAIEKAITPRTRLIIINSPNNPTGAVYSEKTLRMLVDLCFERDIYLLSDETYDMFLYDGVKHFSPASVSKDAKERVITIGSFSKVLGIPGWRLGFLHAPEEFVSQALKAHDSIAICPPRPAQVLFQCCYPYLDDFVDKQVSNLAESRQAMLQRLRQLNEMFDVVSTKGAFYLFPKIIDPRWESRDIEFVHHVLEKIHVLMIPGSYFGEGGAGHLRMAFGNVTKEAIHEAFDRLDNMF